MSTQRFAKPLPEFFIGKTETNNRINYFRDTKYLLLNNALGRNDTKAIWYSMQHIENLYKEMIFMNADGLRIYFGAYPTGHPDFPGQLCLVMVPTYPNEAVQSHKDFAIEDEDYFEDRPGSEDFLEKNIDLGSKDYNYGSPCPPVCPPDGNQIYPF